MNATKRIQVSAIMATRNVSKREAIRLATLNIATDREAEANAHETSALCEALMLQIDKRRTTRSMPSRKWAGENGTGYRTKKKVAKKVIGSVLDIENAMRLTKLEGMGTQAEID